MKWIGPLWYVLLLLTELDAAPRVLFLLGEHEYGTQQSLPAFAAAELKPRDIPYRFIQAKSDDRNSIDCHVFPGLAEALKDADVLFVSVRRRYPPEKDMALLKRWVAEGKPVIGIRTSSHAFGEREKGQGYQAPVGHAAWQDFDRDAFGVSYTGHVGGKTETLVFAEQGVQALSIWTGVELKGEMLVDSHLYNSRDLDPKAIPLIRGKVKGTKEEEPVAWTLQRGKGRRFYTSLGSLKDMEMPALRRLLVNAIYWSAGESPSDAGTIKELRQNRTKEAQDDPLPPEDASRLLETPPDLKLELIASEPVVEQPAFFNFDERGRMWVVQYRQYPDPAGLQLVSKDTFYRAVYDEVPPPPGEPGFVPGKDRITIHADTNGDGQFDSVKTFLDGLSIVTSCVRGRGGVFVLQPPYLLFYADRNNDDIPDGRPKVLLEGFGIEDTHSVCSSLCWGPDGWLYASQGSTVSSAVQVPGSGDPPLRRQGQLIWRYDPDDPRYEVFAEGGGNIWSCEFDSKGRLFAGSNGHHPGFHYLQHAYYKKNFGKHGSLSNPYAYGYFDGIRHPDFKRVTASICVYEGGSLPKRYEGQLIWANPVIGRFGASTLIQEGLGFKGAYLDQLITTRHRWFRPVYVDFGPDGSLYLCDWYDRQVSHTQNYQGHISKKDGRIYRVKGRERVKPFDLNAQSTQDLAELLKHPNRWFRETARRLIDDRPDKLSLVPLLKTMLKGEDTQLGLEALWTLHLCQAVDLEFAMEIGLKHPDPHLRRWTVRLLTDKHLLHNVSHADLLKKVAASDPDRAVRAQCASAAVRLPDKLAAAILEGLLMHPEDAEDAHMPLLTWWVMEKLCRDGLPEIRRLYRQPSSLNEHPMMVRHLAERLGRRLAADGRRSHLHFLETLVQGARGATRKKLVQGLNEAYRGRSLAGLPEGLALELAGTDAGLAFQLRTKKPGAIPQALAALRTRDTPQGILNRLLEVLAEEPLPQARDAILALLEHPHKDTRLAAIHALAPMNDPVVGAALIRRYAGWSSEEKAVARSVITSRLDWSLAWIQLLGEGVVPADALPALARYKDPALAFADHSRNPTELEAEIARVHDMVQQSPGDPYKGRIQFLARCAACHTLHDEGGTTGPDLTAYQRTELDSLLTAIIHPNAEIREGFETLHVRLKDGRMLSGFRLDDDPHVLVLMQVDGTEQVIAREKISSMAPGSQSVMPEGLIDGMRNADLIDLFSYLKASQPLNVK